MQDLALQVAAIDQVEIDETECADPGRSQVQRGGRSQAAGADQQHACALEFRLACEPYIGKCEVPGVAEQLLMRQRRQLPVAAPAIW